MPKPPPSAPGPRLATVVTELALDKGFDYLVPERLAARVQIGSRVLVPFGESQRQGFVVALPEHSEWPLDKMKEIDSVLGERPMIPDQLLRLGEWMAEYYCCSREQGIQALLPAVVRHGRIAQKTHKVVVLHPEADIPKAMADAARKAPKRAEALKLLVRCKTCSLSFLTREAGLSSTVIQGMADLNLVQIIEEPIDRDPFAKMQVLPSSPLPLTDEQAAALAVIRASFAKPRRDTILLHGVTGSGKTEVYLQAIAQCLEEDRESIVLVPEIALTPQTMERFRSRFGDKVSVLHSRLSDGERFDEWTRINEGRVKIAVGARSALFAPFRQLGLIVVDEEHENSYKQSGHAPCYHARDVAVMRGHLENVTVVLGSATPALESWANAQQGKYRLATLAKRVDDQVMPAVEVVDMVEEFDRQGKGVVFSDRLVQNVRETLEAAEQCVLFLNRRGFASFLQCEKCGYVAACEDCSTNFTFHRQAEQLVCHLCGTVLAAPERCPQCAQPGIRYAGMGTEKVEHVAQTLFPQARILRMDSDTMTRKDAYRDALTAFRAGAFDILIGTQMIAKGLHFPNVTLVGVIHADLTLNMPDFRAGERTFQLLVQVAGRAGRGEVPGRVVIQTFTPNHRALQAAIRNDQAGFCEEELLVRRETGLPPASHLAILHFSGPVESAVQETAGRFSERLAACLPRDSKLVPAMPAPIARIRGQFRYQVLVHDSRIVTLSRGLKRLLRQIQPAKDVRVSVDIDPQSLL